MKKINVDKVGVHPIRFLRALRKITGLGLRDAVALRDSLPGVLFDGVPDEMAEVVKHALVSAGSAVRLEETDNRALLIRMAKRLKV